VLPVVAGDELAAAAYPVALAAAVAVDDVVPELVSGRRVRHDGLTSAHDKQFELMFECYA